MPRKPRKIRVSLRKNRQRRSRGGELGRESQADESQAADLPVSERLTGKGELTRRRTILAVDEGAGTGPLRAVEEANCRAGRVLSTAGLHSIVLDNSGRRYECTLRRMIRTLYRAERGAVVAGDRVLFQPLDREHGVIERIEPRNTVLARNVKGKEQLIAANVDQALIVASAASPPLKLGLIDRLLVSAHKGGVRPIICINKGDLVNAARMQPILGMYGRLGYPIVLTSATTGAGLEELERCLKNHETVIAGQSGVGKSSLLNALQPELQLETDRVSDWTQKGRHTTRTAVLHRLAFGGYVADTPGIRQLQLWDVLPGEIEGYFIEFRPFVTFCHFANCSHTHELQCAVKRAVDHDLISPLRYASYLKMISGEPES